LATVAIQAARNSLAARGAPGSAGAAVSETVCFEVAQEKNNKAGNAYNPNRRKWIYISTSLKVWAKITPTDRPAYQHKNAKCIFLGAFNFLNSVPSIYFQQKLQLMKPSMIDLPGMHVHARFHLAIKKQTLIR
jgi:hypothetical protein